MINNGTILNKVSVWATVIAALLAAAGFYYQIVPKTSELRIEIADSQTPTDIPNIPSLQGSFLYKDKPIKDLAIIKLRIENSGNINIIGEGSKKSILGDSLIFHVENAYKLVDLETGSSAFSFLKLSDQSFSLHFKQWRPSDNALVTLYLERLNKNSNKVILPPDDDLIDGKIILGKAFERRNQYLLIDRLPLPLNLIIYFSLFGVCMGSFIFSSMIFKSLIEKRKIEQWREEYRDKIINFARRNEDIYIKSIKEIEIHPERLPSLFWKSSNIIDPPSVFAYGSRDVFKFSFLAFITFIGALAIGSILYLEPLFRHVD